MSEGQNVTFVSSINKGAQHTQRMPELRNIAIIAHVDHGKTTLVDNILHQSKLFGDHEEPQELVLDNNDLEKERGITILSKNVSVTYKQTKINIIDTPGHADFGGEVERVLNMADGALVLVDALEGAMPQTRYVLEKALQLGLRPVLVVNKVDKPNCRPGEVMEEVFDLMFNLGATEEQLDFPVLYGSSKEGWMGEDWENPTSDVSALLNYILEYVPAPVSEEGSLQMQITSLDYSSFIGRIAIGRINSGTLRNGQQVALVRKDGSVEKGKIKELYTFEGLGKVKTEEVHAGDLCAFSGVRGFEIGDTIADPENPEGLKPIAVDEPTMGLVFTINDSPFFGREGDYVTSRQIRDRLFKEVERNLALRVEETDSADAFMVYGRGVMHLAVLIETMRREGYELQVGQPRVLTKEVEGKTHEPIEYLSVESPESTSGKIIELVSQRQGHLLEMHPKGDRTQLEMEIPARGLIGLRTQVLNVTAGEAIMNNRFKGYEPWKGDIPGRVAGAMIAMETGTVVAYSLDKLQDRGKFFVEPNDEVYAGQVVGEHGKENDLEVKVTKTKKLTNVRSATADEKMKIAPPVRFSLEECMEFIAKDEFVEVTPKSLRLRKTHLTESERKRAEKQNG